MTTCQEMVVNYEEQLYVAAKILMAKITSHAKRWKMYQSTATSQYCSHHTKHM